VILVIASFHRSFTSLTAQWLHAAGISFPGPLMGAGVGNEFGHFENLDFLSLSTRFNQGQISAASATGLFREQYAEQIESESWFALKAPDAVPIALELVKKGYVSWLIIPSRPFKEISDSYCRRLNSQLEKGVFRFSLLKRTPFLYPIWMAYHKHLLARSFRLNQESLRKAMTLENAAIIDFSQSSASEMRICDLKLPKTEGLNVHIRLSSVQKKPLR